MDQRIRIKDIAEKAGVSTGTVDRVIHQRGNVSHKVKEKVLRVMEVLGYERNIIASTLAYNRVFSIAVLLPDSSHDLYWEQPKLGIEKAYKNVLHYGVSLKTLYFDQFDPKSFLDKAEELWRDGSLPDAVLFTPLFYKESLQLLAECKRKNIPNAIINTNIENSESLCFIGPDSYQSGVLGARLLNFGLNRGETVMILNLAMGSANAQHLIEKESGFRDYFDNVKDKEIKVVKTVFEEFHDAGKLKEFLKVHLKIYPKLTALFVTNSRAYKVLECLTREEIDKIKIVGFDLIEPNLVHLRNNKLNFIINQNPVQQGYLGVMNIVNHLILKKQVDKVQYLPLDIVVNENVEYYLRKKIEYQLVL